MLVDVYHAFGEWAITLANLLVPAFTVSYLVLVERSTCCPLSTARWN